MFFIVNVNWYFEKFQSILSLFPSRTVKLPPLSTATIFSKKRILPHVDFHWPKMISCTPRARHGPAEFFPSLLYVKVQRKGTLSPREALIESFGLSFVKRMSPQTDDK